ncbi:FtsK/SpoIIIE domain-containing protein [Streptomyces sp. NPDC093707]|uniref:FtsK/SpoIIIE domain-containing protein n=1 Tax=Streptomyces sp. NPDC093707 TaxID=3154984 RepID=UPI00344B59E7
MGTITIKRRPRKWPDEYSKDAVQLKAPPALPRQPDGSLTLMLLPAAAMAGTSAFFFLPESPAFMKMMGTLMVLSSLGMALAQVVRARRGPTAYMSGERRRYLSYLARTREQVSETARQQRQAERYLFPEPIHLWALVAQRTRLWERRPGDADFVEVRIGVGPQRLATELIGPPSASTEEWEPLTERAVRRFVAAHAHLDGLPLAISLRAFPWLTVHGEAEAVYGLARAVVGQLAALHSPEDFRLAVVAAPGAAPEWEWIKWLPHAYLGGDPSGPKTGLLICDSLDELEEVLAEDLAARPVFRRDEQPLLDRPHLVVLVDSGNHPPAEAPAEEDALHGVTVIEIVPGHQPSSPLYGQPVLTASASTLRLETGTGAAYTGIPDALSSTEATALARALAPLRTRAQEDEEPLLRSLDFTELMDIVDPAALDVAQMWRQRRPADRLRVPIGVDKDGAPVILDLKEASQGGMGPHGLCVGATGSGKSELLRTLVLGLATTRASRQEP